MKICGRKPKLSAEQFRRLLQWAEFGTTRAEVARNLGVHPGTITEYLRRRHKTYRNVA